MFFVTGDYSANYITADQLRIELKAGGLNQSQEDHVIGHIMHSTYAEEVNCYITIINYRGCIVYHVTILTSRFKGFV